MSNKYVFLEERCTSQIKCHIQSIIEEDRAKCIVLLYSFLNWELLFDLAVYRYTVDFLLDLCKVDTQLYITQIIQASILGTTCIYVWNSYRRCPSICRSRDRVSSGISIASEDDKYTNTKVIWYDRLCCFNTSTTINGIIWWDHIVTDNILFSSQLLWYL